MKIIKWILPVVLLWLVVFTIVYNSKNTVRNSPPRIAIIGIQGVGNKPSCK